MTVAVRSVRAEKAAETKRRILDATIDVLLERGYRRTSTLEVQKRAGVSRGALLHHFPSRADLLVATVEHLRRKMVVGLPSATTNAPKAKRVQWAVERLWSTFQGPLYVVTVELWQAARSDADIRAALVPQERMIGAYVDQLGVELFGPEISSRPGFRDRYEILLDAQRGAAARSAIRSTSSDKRLIRRWVSLMESVT